MTKQIIQAYDYKDEISFMKLYNKNRLDTIHVKLDLLNPDNILDKGYSIIYKDNKIVKNINSISKDDNINIVVKNGNIDAIVKGVKNGKERK